MTFAHEYYAVVEFLNRGGIMLYIILIFAFLLWSLLIERFYLLYISIAKSHSDLLISWQQHRESMEVLRIRKSLQHIYSCRLKATLPLIRMLIAMIPMLGLLGTVWGMIEIFDVIAIEGTGDAKAMAGGISMATLPTMSGMAIAIVTLFAFRKLEDKTDRSIAEFQERMI